LGRAVFDSKLKIKNNGLSISKIGYRTHYAGSQAYIVFKSAYDFVLKLLKTHIADDTLNYISDTYFTDSVIFTQHVLDRSMTVPRSGYAYCWITAPSEDPPSGFKDYLELISDSTDDTDSTDSTDNI
jgi:hypothetical protein